MHGHYKQGRLCSELLWKERGQQIKGPYCLPPQDAGELSCGVLCSPLVSFVLSPVLERSRETEEGSTEVVRDLEHMCYRERRRKLGLVSLVKRAKEPSQSCLELFGG